MDATNYRKNGQISDSAIKLEVNNFHKRAANIAQWLAVMLTDLALVGSIPTIPRNFQIKKLLTLQRLEESGQWLENVIELVYYWKATTTKSISKPYTTLIFSNLPQIHAPLQHFSPEMKQMTRMKPRFSCLICVARKTLMASHLDSY